MGFCALPKETNRPRRKNEDTNNDLRFIKTSSDFSEGPAEVFFLGEMTFAAKRILVQSSLRRRQKIADL